MPNTITSKWNYFTDDEVKNLDNEFVAKLDMARHKSGIPYIITDGFRTPATNKDPNAVADSAHLKGLAVDLRCHSSYELFKIMQGLFASGFRRMGVYYRIDGGKSVPTHIHVDSDQDKAQDVIWSEIEK